MGMAQPSIAVVMLKIKAVLSAGSVYRWDKEIFITKVAGPSSIDQIIGVQPQLVLLTSPPDGAVVTDDNTWSAVYSHYADRGPSPGTLSRGTPG